MKSSRDLISVVIPAYNAQATIGRAVQSVINQTDPAWEVVLVADDRVDYQRHLTDLGIEDDRIRFLCTARHGSGAVNARNLAIHQANSRYIAILDSDDAMLPQKLEWAREPLAEYGLVSSAVAIHNDAGLVRHVGERDHDGMIKAQEYIFVNFTTHSSVVYDHERMPALSDARFDVIEDQIVMLQRFTYVDQLYHFGQPLHVYYKDNGSVSGSSGAFSTFVEQKEEALRRIRSKHYPFKNEAIRHAYELFYLLAIEAEHQFNADRLVSSGLIYEDVFERVCQQTGSMLAAV